MTAYEPDDDDLPAGDAAIALILWLIETGRLELDDECAARFKWWANATGEFGEC